MQRNEDGPLETQACVVPEKGAKLILRNIILPPLMPSQVAHLNVLASRLLILVKGRWRWK